MTYNEIIHKVENIQEANDDAEPKLCHFPQFYQAVDFNQWRYFYKIEFLISWPFIWQLTPNQMS